MATEGILQAALSEIDHLAAQRRRESTPNLHRPHCCPNGCDPLSAMRTGEADNDSQIDSAVHAEHWRCFGCGARWMVTYKAVRVKLTYRGRSIDAR